MAKSSTPLNFILTSPSVSLACEQDLEAQGHVVQHGLMKLDTLLENDILLGPQCYNTEGELSKKQLDVLTKSTRALVRAKKKAEREQAKLEKEKHGPKN